MIVESWATSSLLNLFILMDSKNIIHVGLEYYPFFLLFEIFTLPVLFIINLDTANPTQTVLMHQRIVEAREQHQKFSSFYLVE